MPRRYSIAAIVSACLAAGAALAQTAAPEAPLVRSRFMLPVEIAGKSYGLEAMEIRPRGPGPFPLAVIVHGKPSGEAARKALSSDSMTVQAAEFARRGYVALAALRRGYGKSQGHYAESDGDCTATRYPQATRVGASDTQAIAASGAKREGVDGARVLAAGESVGGIVALAWAQSPPPELKGAINFAGGRGGDPAQRGAVCQSDKLVAAVGALGAGSKLPTLWVYAENDTVFGPTLARTMLDAFRQSGGQATLAVLPPVQRDGHAVFANGTRAWADPVDAFLKRLGLPAGIKVKPPRQNPPLALGPNGHRAFAQYESTAMPFRAFAVSGKGGFAWAASVAALDKARSHALALCQRGAPVCRVTTEYAEIEDR
ncbi:MAG: alpha/beta hydrolase family protein [Rhodospirillales bacterium]